jgi:hypothetical protein
MQLIITLLSLASIGANVLPVQSAVVSVAAALGPRYQWDDEVPHRRRAEAELDMPVRRSDYAHEYRRDPDEKAHEYRSDNDEKAHEYRSDNDEKAHEYRSDNDEKAHEYRSDNDEKAHEYRSDNDEKAHEYRAVADY